MVQSHSHVLVSLDKGACCSVATLRVIKQKEFGRRGLCFCRYVGVRTTELACSPGSRNIAERSDHCLFRVGVSVCRCRRSLLGVRARPERLHLEVLLRGQRSKLLNLSDNVYV